MTERTENRLKDEFYRGGYEDFENDIDYEECPHDEGTDSEYGWRLGWKQAKKDNKKPVWQQYQEIKAELEFNQQEYKSKQEELAKKLKDLQKHCPHDELLSTQFDEPTTVCKHCGKVLKDIL
jgi:ribosome modulation factor